VVRIHRIPHRLIQLSRINYYRNKSNWPLLSMDNFMELASYKVLEPKDLKFSDNLFNSTVFFARVPF
jgi:hypothetical protein